VASEGVKFVKNSYGTPSTNIPLSEADMYGTSQKQPYVNNLDSFWLKIPASRAEALGSPASAADGIVIHALGKALDKVTSSGDVPMVLVYQNPSTGVQDWNEVQAFIGLAREGEKVTLYGESLHPVYNSGYDPSLSEGELRISKRVTNGTDADRAARYTFRLAMFAGGQMLPVQLVPGHNITGSSGLSAVSEDGVFTLSDGGEVNIKHLPVIFGTYSLVETTDPSRYETSFKRGSGSERSAPGINMYLYPGVTSNTVSVTNNILQSPPSSPSPSGPPLTIVNKPFVPTGGTGTPHDPFEGRLILPCCPCPESLKASDISASEPADITFSVDATFTRETWSSCDLYTDAEVTLYFTVGFTDGSVYYYKAWLSKEALPLPTLVREVILPGVAGVTSNPPPGRHYIESGTNFKFTLTPDNSLLLAEAQLLVTTNRKGVPAADDVEITANGDGSYTYLIRSIRQALDISIEIVMPEEVAGSESVAGEKVWADSHTLYIYATQNGAARIYSITGQLAATVQCAAGETAQARLPAGIYAVKTATAVHKVVVR
ncbi:MAG: hypothetical protein LBF85_10195, partial [Tannerella sp.]|jgi:hypothetical protein|nr:hypothetical protein [Tannerella sp.]